jgi:hypothetical protein
VDGGHGPGRYDDSSGQELASDWEARKLAVQGVGQGCSWRILASRMLFGESICFRVVVDVVVVEVDRTSSDSSTPTVLIAAGLRYGFVASEKVCHTSRSPTNAPDLPKMASAFLDPIPISSKEYAFTDSGNVISRSAKIYGASNIVINGRSVIEKGCVIRGDLQRVVATPGVGGSAGTMSMQLASNTTSVNAGRYLSVGQGTVLRPPGKLYKGLVSSRCKFLSASTDATSSCI